MAAVQPPAYIQASSHPADVFRRALKALRENTGVVLTADLAVVQNGTPNMSVNVAAGTAVIDGTENSVTQGTYICTNDAVVNLAIASSDPTNPRNDLVVAKVQDAAYSGGTNAWSLAVVTGTPAGSPVDPATPVDSITLARVRVDALVTTIVNAKITDLRPFVHGAIFPGAAGFTLWDSTGALKNAAWTDAGAMALRNPAITVPPSVGGIVPAGAASVPIKIDDILVGTDSRYPAATASITFLNTAGVGTNLLPTGYRHLLIEWYARGDAAAVNNTTLLLRFNNDSGNNYDYEFVRFNAAVTTPAETLTTNAILLGRITAVNATAAYFGHGSAEIKHYNGAVGNKHTLSRYFANFDNATSNQETGQVGGKWRTTATPITRIDLLPASGNFINASLFTLWGLP